MVVFTDLWAIYLSIISFSISQLSSFPASSVTLTIGIGVPRPLGHLYQDELIVVLMHSQPVLDLLVSRASSAYAMKQCRMIHRRLLSVRLTLDRVGLNNYTGQ